MTQEVTLLHLLDNAQLLQERFDTRMQRLSRALSRKSAAFEQRHPHSPLGTANGGS
jgi:hypothetical protein